MKNLNLFAAVIFVVVLFNSCQSEKEIYGKWSIEDIEMKENVDEILFVGLALSDFSYYEFTSENELLLYNSKDELLQKERFLLSEDGKELLIKGSVDQVLKIEIISKTEIKLEDENCIIKLTRK
ncbi:MAG TPA: hypothetical protein PKN32_06465 [Bacteroidales bacterium]|nr:hypothetical protein [Bacteroidales bacterium]